MKIRVLKLFGREVARWETWQEATVSDVVAAVLAAKLAGDDDDEELEDEESEEMVPCICCGELFSPYQEAVDRKFDDIADRILWDVKTDDDQPPPCCGRP